LSKSTFFIISLVNEPSALLSGVGVKGLKVTGTVTIPSFRKYPCRGK
jgi:hypothetical protein